jgi:hypothetical protein
MKDLWEAALAATEEGEDVEGDLADALWAGEWSHILTIGSPVRGLCLRITMGHLGRSGRWYGWLPDVFLIWRGKRL